MFQWENVDNELRSWLRGNNLYTAIIKNIPEGYQWQVSRNAAKVASGYTEKLKGAKEACTTNLLSSLAPHEVWNFLVPSYASEQLMVDAWNTTPRETAIKYCSQWPSSEFPFTEPQLGTVEDLLAEHLINNLSCLSWRETSCLIDGSSKKALTARQGNFFAEIIQKAAERYIYRIFDEKGRDCVSSIQCNNLLDAVWDAEKRLENEVSSETLSLRYQRPKEIWEWFISEYTPQEFIHPGEGPEESITKYVKEINHMFDINYTAEQLSVICSKLTDYARENTGHITGKIAAAQVRSQRQHEREQMNLSENLPERKER